MQTNKQTNRNVLSMHGKKSRQLTLPLRGPDIGHYRQKFKAAIVNVSKELKDIALKELK